MPGFHALRRFRPSLGLAPVVAILAAVLVVLVGGWQLLRGRDAALRAAETNASTLARSLAQHAGRSIEAVDLTLNNLVYQVERGRDALDAMSFPRSRGSLPQVRNFIVTDAEGAWLADSAPPHPPVSSADRAYFRWHREHPDRGLHIDSPIIGRTSNLPGIPLSRRIDGPDGAFAGIAIATLAPDYFGAFYDTVKTGGRGTVALWTTDGRLLVRYPVLPEGDGRASATVASAVEAFTKPSGTFISHSPFDGVERIFAFERVGSYPLVVSAATATDDALAGWHEEATLESAVVGAAALVLLALAVILERHRRRMTALEGASREADRRYRYLADHSTDLVTLRAGFSDTRTYVSPSSLAIVGRTPDELAALPIRDFVHPDDRDRVEAVFASLSPRTPRATCLYRVRHKAGHDVWLEGVFKLTEDATVLICARDVTARRRAEQALEESESRYRLLADNTTDMITHMDLTGRRLFVSPASRDLLGFHPADLVGTRPQEMIHPEDASGLRRVLDDLASGGRDRAVTVNRLRHRDGTWIWVEASLKLLRDRDGRPSGYVAAIRNIMDRQRADAALRDSEARYRLLADHSTDLIALKPMFDGPRSYVSPSVRAVTGYEPEEFVVLPASDYVHPDDRERVAAEFASLTIEHPGIKSLHRVRHKDGHWIWTEVDFHLTHAGLPDQSVIVRARDVTARRMAEEALAESEARYRVLAETTSDVISQLDLDLVRRYVSPSCRSVLGYEPEELLGIVPLTQMHLDDAAGVRARLLRLAAGEVEGDRATVTYRTRHKRGHWVWIEAVMTLVRDEVSGAPSSLIGSLRDVTERQRVARHLERAKIAAETAAKAKAEFVANMSHELRTPLTGIIGVHDLLREDPSLGAAQRRLLDLAAEAGHSLLGIVNDVLDSSKIDAGRLLVESLPFDLGELIASCRDLTRQGLKGKPLEILTTGEPERLGWFLGDPNRIRQILLNLLTNAVKFTEEGRVTIAAEYRDADATLRITIVDSGIGIPPERVASLFERFTQGDTSVTRRYGGTGLGLAICRQLTDLMGGCIGVEPRPGGGSIFWFELPLPRQQGGGPADITGVETGTAQRLRLLLAEDNLLNVEIITAMLESRGHTVSVVADGASAVAAAGAGFDAILMDLQMPVMDGLTATAAIRAEERAARRRPMPIIGLTANAMAEDAERCLAAGMDVHVAKPVDRRVLFAVLDQVASRDAPAALGARSPDGTSVLEIDTLQELSDLVGRDRLAAMLTRFVEDLLARLDRFETGSASELSDHLHSLASSSGQLGFRQLSALCAEVDAQARRGRGFERVGEIRRAAQRAADAARRSGFGKVA